jgi:amidase
MTRTVRDAALLLNAMAGSDDADPVKQPQALKGMDYTALLQPDSLVARRIGYPVKFDASGQAMADDPQFSEALEVMQAAGATLIPVEFKDPDSAGVEEAMAMSFKKYVPQYLATRPGLAVDSVEEIVRFTENALGTEGHGHAFLTQVENVVFDERTYKELWQNIQRENAAVIDELLTTHQLDAVVMDVGSPGLNVISLAGYPGIMMPSGDEESGVPTSVFFFGTRWSEATLLALAYGYEQASHARQVPQFKP